MIHIVVLLFLSVSPFVSSETNGTDTEVRFKFIQEFCSKIHVTSPIGCCRVNKGVFLLGYTLLALVVGFIGVPLLFCICGFCPVGVREGSFAAEYQSVHGTPKPFSCLQSLSMTGIVARIIFVIGIVLASIKIFYWDKRCS